MATIAELDLEALRQARLRRTQEEMLRAGVEALILFRADNLRYAAGARHSLGVPGNYSILPTICVVLPEGEPDIFIVDPDGVPRTIPKDKVHGVFVLDTEAGRRNLTSTLGSVIGYSPGMTVGVDEGSWLLQETLRTAFPKAKFVDGMSVMAHARSIKLPAEVECIRSAERITEEAMWKVIEHIRPGIQEARLNGIFLQEIAARGSNWSFYEGTWCAQHKALEDEPFLAPGAVPYRHLATDRVLEEGDLVSIDSGAIYQGYFSDFGRTWYCGVSTRPSQEQKDCFKQWYEQCQRMLERCRPGNTVADLHRAVSDIQSNIPLVGHGLGLSIEPPIVGGGPERLAEEEQWVLAPGMVFNIEPYVWKEGAGGVRCDETIVITENGYESITNFPYGPLADS